MTRQQYVLDELPRGPEPGQRILGTALVTDLEIEAGSCLPSRITDPGDGLALCHRIAPVLEKALVVAIERQITVTMIDDDELTKPPEPVGEDDASGKDGLYGTTTATRDNDPPPSRTET